MLETLKKKSKKNGLSEDFSLNQETDSIDLKISEWEKLIKFELIQF